MNVVINTFFKGLTYFIIFSSTGFSPLGGDRVGGIAISETMMIVLSNLLYTWEKILSYRCDTVPTRLVQQFT